MARVLVVDDSLTIRKLAEIAFRGLDHVVDFAANGKDGIERAVQTKPDVVLLDFVLPDMKGVEVCEQMWLAHLQSKVLVMSGKGDSLREVFAPYPNVAGFLPKPFGPPDLLRTIAPLLHAPPAPVPSAGRPVAGVVPETQPSGNEEPVFSFEQKESAAQVIFSHLRRRLALVPEWWHQSGGRLTGAALAQKMLTPESVNAMLQELAPMFRAGNAAPASDPAKDGLLSGRVSGATFLDVLALAASQCFPVELRVKGGAEGILVVKQGRVIHAGATNPELVPPPSGLRIGPDALSKSVERQRVDGLPYFLSLVGARDWTADDAKSALDAYIRALVARMVDGSCDGAPFTATRLTEVPGHWTHVGAYVSVAQFRLEQLRKAALVDVRQPTEDSLVDRCPSFSARVSELRMNGEERRVLSAFSARSTVADIARRSELSTAQVQKLLSRFAALDLVTFHGTEDRPVEARPVLIIDDDDEGFVRPLSKLLASRTPPSPVVPVRPGSVVEAMRPTEPALVLINATNVGADNASRLAKEIRATASMEVTLVVALLDHHDRAEREALLRSGFDDVLVKPISLGDFEQLIGS